MKTVKFLLVLVKKKNTYISRVKLYRLHVILLICKHPHTTKHTAHYTYSTLSHISLSDVTKNLGLLT